MTSAFQYMTLTLTSWPQSADHVTLSVHHMTSEEDYKMLTDQYSVFEIIIQRHDLIVSPKKP